MKVEQTPSGKYRVRKMVNGKNICITFDHEPKEIEITKALVKRMEDVPVITGTFFSCVEQYIQAKSNILSPSTIISYKQLKGQFPHWLNKPIQNITQMDVQRAVNEFASNHSAKTVKNYHGLISSVLKMYRPNFSLHTTLPKGKPKELSIPSHDDIVRILKEVEGTEFHIPFQLGCLGLRKGEILALNLDDLRDDYINIDKCMVISEQGGYEVKNLPKTVSSVRRVYIPKQLADEIREKGYIYNGYQGQLLKTLHRVQDKLGIPRCRFHDLRHYFVSYAHSLGWSDADIISITGHKTDEIARRVYRHSMANVQDKIQLANDILG